MTRRAFQVAGWAALVVGCVTAIVAAAVVVTGALALAGKTTYPVDVGVGPFSIHSDVSVPVRLGADVCQSADVRDQESPSDCLKFFVHDGNWSGEENPVRVQDSDVRPTSATLTGDVALATTGGWSPFIAASVARTVLNLAVISAILLLTWQLLANASTGAVFSSRAVRHVRTIGWLLIGAAAAQAALGLLTGANQLGYSFETFGYGPQLAPLGNAGINYMQIALGGLVLLVAEVFRQGAAVEAEQRLTV